MDGQKAEVGEIAARQGGRIQLRQLYEAGWSWMRVQRACERGELIRTLRGVYAVGYVRHDRLARLWEAVLYAGPGAALTGAAAAHHCELIHRASPAITVTSPRKSLSTRDITVIGHRRTERRVIGGLPVVPLSELMLDLATEVDDTQLRFALGNLEFRRQLHIDELLDACGRGRRGSRQLRSALARRLPQLARTKSRHEVSFLLLLEAHRLPLPEVNVRVHGIEVDCLYRELGLVIEIDTSANHGTAAQRRRDADRTAILAAHGLTVLRLSDVDIHHRVRATLETLAAHGVTAGC